MELPRIVFDMPSTTPLEETDFPSAVSCMFYLLSTVLVDILSCFYKDFIIVLFFSENDILGFVCTVSFYLILCFSFSFS